MATSSLVPTHAATSSAATSAPQRRASQSAAAARNAGVPTDLGYAASAPDPPSAATAAGGGGSHGSPSERSTQPPACWLATARSRTSRSYG